MITLKTTDKLRKHITRAKKMQQIQKDLAMGIIKTEAKQVIEIFHDGIINDDLGLIALKPETVQAKTRQKMPHPNSPLAGKSDQRDGKKDSYANMLVLKKTKYGYKITPSDKKHWSGKMKLSDLFQIHEMGMKIQTKSGKIIQIPKRPALKKSYLSYHNRKHDIPKMFNKFVKGYIARGSHVNKINTYLKEYKGDKE